MVYCGILIILFSMMLIFTRVFSKSLSAVLLTYLPSITSNPLYN